MTTKKSEWTPISIVESVDDSPKDGGVTLRRRLSATPDVEWQKHFSMVGTNRQGSHAFIDLQTDPDLNGDTVRWTVPAGDAKGGSDAITDAVAAANDRYSDQLSDE